MATVAFTLAGQAIGAQIGGSFLGISAATLGGALGMVAGNLLGPKPPEQRGPRLTNLDVATATPGTPIPVSWGAMRVQGDPIWAPKLTRRVKKTNTGGKGSGSSQTYQTEYATGSWCVSFGYNRNGVPRTLRRVWANKKLEYDATGSLNMRQSRKLSFTYYDGTQTTPDPAMEGVIGEGNVPAYTGQALMVMEDQDVSPWGNQIPLLEAELVDNASSTQSASYVDLTDYAGFEGLTDAQGMTLYDPIRELIWYSFIGGGVGKGGAIFVVNPYTRQVVWKFVMNDAEAELNAGQMYLVSYTALYDRILVDRGSYLSTFDTTTFAHLGDVEHSIGTDIFTVFDGYIQSGNQIRFFTATASTGAAQAITTPTGYASSLAVGAAKPPTADIYGRRTLDEDEAYAWLESDTLTDRYGFFEVQYSIISGVQLVQVASVGSYASIAPADGFSGFNMPKGDFNGEGVYVDYTDSFWFPFTNSVGDSDVYLIEVDASDGSIIGGYKIKDRITDYTGDLAFANSNDEPLLYYDDEQRRIWLTAPDAVVYFNVASKDGKAYQGTAGNSAVYYHPPSGIVHGSDQSNERLFQLSLENVTQSGIAVASVVRDICVRCGVASTDVEFTNVVASVTGAIANQQTSGKDMINPLLQYAYADGYESEYKLKFVARGAAVATAVSSSWINAVDTGQDPRNVETLLPHTIELPKSLDMRFFNAENNYQIGNAHYTWHSSQSERRGNAAFPIAITPQQAINRTTLLLHAMYERRVYNFTAGVRYSAIEPTDIITLPVNGRTERVRVERVHRGANDILAFTARQDRQQHATSYASAAGVATRADVITELGPVFPLWIDTPLLQDNDGNHPGPYITLYNYASSFQPAALFTSSDDNAYSEAAQFDAQAPVGIVQNTPTDVSDFGSWDEVNTITVNYFGGSSELQSISSAAVLAGGNAAAYGKPGRFEILQYRSVAVASTGFRQHSGLLRGRRGTDAYINTHEDNDWFIVLDDSAISRLSYAVADINSLAYLRAVHYGDSYADVTPAVFSVTPRALQPYSPISVSVASVVGSSAIETVWTRRTRAGGSYVGLFDNVGGPLNEDTESYQIDVRNPATGSTIVSGIATTSTNFVYASASQEADGVNSLGTVAFNIFQISAAVGRGFPASVSYERPWPAGVKYALNLGAELYIPFTDASTGGPVADWYGSTVGTYSSVKTPSASVRIGAINAVGVSAVISGTGSSIVNLGDAVHKRVNSNKEFSLGIWLDADVDYGTAPFFINTPGNTSTAGLSIQYDLNGLTSRWSPKGNGQYVDVNGAAQGHERDYAYFAVFTFNASSKVSRVYGNGEKQGSAVLPFPATTHEWTSYATANAMRIGGTVGGGVGTQFRGRFSDLMLFPTELTEAQVSTLFEKQQGYIDWVEAKGADHLWTLDAVSFGGSFPDRIDTDDITNIAAVQPGVINACPCAHYGAEFDTTRSARIGLSSLPELTTQNFTLETWVYFDAVGASAPFLTAWPAGAYASAKGVQLYYRDSGDGIVARYGNGDGTFRELISSVGVTSARTHVQFVKASGLAPQLRVNGSTVAVGASAIDIDWDDATGTPAPPSGQLYLNRSNRSNTATVSADTNGINGQMNMVAIYSSAISSTNTMNTYLFGSKQLY